jgi:hypothetical protein
MRALGLTRIVGEKVKLLRAHGGCLGARSRRRTWPAAISLGKLQASVITGDFRMGKPAADNTAASLPEHIGRGREPGELKHLSTPRKRDNICIP